MRVFFNQLKIWTPIFDRCVTIKEQPSQKHMLKEDRTTFATLINRSTLNREHNHEDLYNNQQHMH